MHQPTLSSGNNLLHTSSGNATVFEFPSVDGVVAGRAAAVGALCRIVCAKSSEETLPDDQLAHFYLVLHEALLEVNFLQILKFKI